MTTVPSLALSRRLSISSQCCSRGLYRGSYAVAQRGPALQQCSVRQFGLTSKLKGWIRGQDTSQNTTAWFSEARRFLEYEKYDMHAFKSHLMMVVKSYEESGVVRRGMRGLMKFFNAEAWRHQQSLVDESRSLVQIIEGMPKEAYADPSKYFRGGKRARMAQESKMSSAEINQVLSKFENNKMIHGELKRVVSRGDEMPQSSEEVYEMLMSPEHVDTSYRKQQRFNASNPNRSNEVFDGMLDSNERMFESPWRKRPSYRFRRKWYQRDWRLYQPKWQSTDALTLNEETDETLSIHTKWRRDPDLKAICLPATLDPRSTAQTNATQKKSTTADVMPESMQPVVDSEVMEFERPEYGLNPFQKLHHLRHSLKKNYPDRRKHKKRLRLVCDDGRHSVLADVRPQLLGTKHYRDKPRVTDPSEYGVSQFEIRKGSL